MIEINKSHPKEVNNIVKNETLTKKVDFSRPQKNKKPFSKLSRKKKIIVAVIAVLVLLIISVGVYFLLAKKYRFQLKCSSGASLWILGQVWNMS